MSRRLDYTVKFDAPGEKIYQDLTRRRYWETLMEAYQGVTPLSEITRFHCGDDGTQIVFTQTLPRAYLPPIARTVMPVDMIITREQHFEPYDKRGNRASGTYAASIPAGPGHFGGRYVLTDTDTGSQLRLASVCKVYIPFIGGRLEDLILSNITLLFEAEAAFTADWICQHR
jgi:Protein of unknown function (DUF2505)